MKKVVKFGGSSLASAGQFQKVKAIILADSSRRFVVPSAPGKRCSDDVKVTDLLYRYYDLLSGGQDGEAVRVEIRSRYEDILSGLDLDYSLEPEFEIIAENFRKGFGRDYAASRGEYLNGLIMAEYLGVPFVDAAEVVCFDREGRFLPEETNRVMSARLAGLDRAVIPGFYGALPDGTIKTFSRGGSDISGSLVARAVRADLYENWTDVSGFLLADPHIVDDPVPIGTITYQELHELSCMGASVLHEDTVFPVKKAGIPINIKNTNRPQDPGTMIVSSTSQRLNYRITGIAGKKGYCAVNIRKPDADRGQGFDRKVLRVLEQTHIPFESLAHREDTLSVLVDQKEFLARQNAVLNSLQRSVRPDSISLEADLALVAVGRRDAKSRGGVSGRVFSALEQAHIRARALDRSPEEQTTVVGVKNEDFEQAIRAIYDNFITFSSGKGSVSFSM